MTTRRNILQFAGGAAVGALFTPAPWRLITDAALWSENWPGIPRPARGEIRTRFTHCAMCPAGCGVRARCVGDQPVALAGARGGLCPFGMAGHHLPSHPARLLQGPVEEARAALAEAIAASAPDRKIAVLDLRPGRTASWTYRRAMGSLPGGLYLAPELPPAAYDLASAKTVLTLGIPLLDGWGAPATVFAARGRFRLIHAGAVESRTAALADQWLPVRPASEDALARAVAGEIAPAEAARAMGISEAEIVSVMAQLKANRPAIVIGNGPAAIAANRALGALGKTVVAAVEVPVPPAWRAQAASVTSLEAVPDSSIRALFIDESAPGEYLPWEAIAPKLAQNPVVVTVSSTRAGYGRHAGFVLPAPVYPELTDDFPPAVDSISPHFRLASPLVKAPEGTVGPAELVASLAGLNGDPLRERADWIHRSGEGALIPAAGGQSTPVKELKPDDFWNALNEGAAWLGPARATAPVMAVARRIASEDASDLPLRLMLSEERRMALVSPIMTKVYEESDLRLRPNRIAIGPEAARQAGLEDGARAWLETRRGKAQVTVSIDSGLPPGVVQAAARPALLDLCCPEARARVVRA